MPHFANTFSFNPEKFDFWEIYRSISKYYAPGIPRDESGFFKSFQGYKDLVALIVDNTHNEKNFETRWVSFDREIERLSKKKVIGTTYGSSPCFSAYIEIDNERFENFKHFKELHYFISFLGNFYTVIGVDGNKMKIPNDVFNTTNYLAVSPINEFAEMFNLLCQQIELRFKDFKFVPFNICAQKIIGLNTGDNVEIKDTVFDALFGSTYFSIANKFLGDDYYKSEQWIREGYIDGGSNWTIYPPL